MTISKPQEIWEFYKRLLESKEFDEWGNLWANDGQFVIAYGKENFGEETYQGRENIVSFFSDSREKVKIYFENDVFQATKNPDIFFVTFDFNAIITASRNHYKNRIVCQFTLDKQGKINERIEYVDPIKRQAFLEELSIENPAYINLETRASILQSTFEHYFKMAMDHHTKVATTSHILLIVVAAIR